MIHNVMFILPHILNEFTPHWNETLSIEDYHADKTAVSSSGLRHILKSPFAFHENHRGQVDIEESAAFRIGHAAHMAILEPEKFEKCIVIQPEFSGTGSVKARQLWKHALSPGALTLKPEEYETVVRMVEGVWRHRAAKNILRNGQVEVSGYYRDELTGIKCRIRPDFLRMGNKVALLDVKTTVDISKASFSRSCASYNYGFQMAQYIEGIRLITGKNVDYPLFLAIEKKAPYECALYQADEEMLAIGLKDYRRALDLLKRSIDKNFWPGIQAGGIETIGLPKWALNNEEVIDVDGE